jgi:hypothetical protein
VSGPSRREIVGAILALPLAGAATRCARQTPAYAAAVTKGIGKGVEKGALKEAGTERSSSR